MRKLKAVIVVFVFVSVLCVNISICTVCSTLVHRSTLWQTPLILAAVIISTFPAAVNTIRAGGPSTHNTGDITGFYSEQRH